MDNPTVKELTLTLDKERTLVMDLNAQCLFEEETGKNFYEVLLSKEMASASDHRALLWALLKRDDPNITIEQAGGLVSTLFDILKKIQELYKNSQPDDEELESEITEGSDSESPT